MQPRYATSMQIMLPKLPRKLEQTAELYPSRRDFRTAMGEKAQKHKEQFRGRSEKSQVDSSDCISLPHNVNLARFARFHRYISIDSSDFKALERLKSANATDSTKTASLHFSDSTKIISFINADSSDSIDFNIFTHFSHLAESAGFSHYQFSHKLHTQRIYDDR